MPQVHDDTVLEVASSASNPVPSTFVLPAAGMPATSVHALWSGREVEGGGRRVENEESWVTGRRSSFMGCNESP